jgi:hypothetical protein
LGNAEHFLRKKKNRSTLKNKTHKTLTRKFLLGISLPVAKVTAFETNEGNANGVVTFRETAAAERFAVAKRPSLKPKGLLGKIERFFRAPG